MSPAPFSRHYREGDRKVDVIAERPSGEIVGVEVKASATVRAKDLAGLRHLREQVGERMVGGAILYAGADTLPFGERTWAIPLQALWATGSYGGAFVIKGQR
jgi:predicted AAA+ superfamily ATPase